jgi:hypothetical protein
MLDSLVRVSRRVGRVADADAADADAPNLVEPSATAAESAGTCEQVPTAIGRPPRLRTSVRSTRARLRVRARYANKWWSPAIGARAGGKPEPRGFGPSTRAPRRPVGIGRGAYRREVRRSFALRSTSRQPDLRSG